MHIDPHAHYAFPIHITSTKPSSLLREALQAAATRCCRAAAAQGGADVRRAGGGETAKLEWGERTRARERGVSTTDHQHDEGETYERGRRLRPW